MLRSILVLCISILLLSCNSLHGPRSITSSSTVSAEFSRSWISSRPGYIYATHYFTSEQTDDPAWEAVRLSKMDQVLICRTGKKVVRRDVRWFPVTRKSGQRCSAIIYTVKCDIPTLVPEDTSERDRREALLGELDEVPSKGCGGKDRILGPDEPDYDMKQYLHAQALLADAGGCDFVDRQLDAEIVIFPQTRIGSSTTINRALAARFNEGYLSYLARDLPEYPERIIGSALLRVGKLSAIFPSGGKAPRSSANIELVQTVGLGRDGRPYCVQLTALQGGRVWRRTIERSGAEGYAGIGIFPRTAKPTDDISLQNDVRQLLETLGNSMGMPAETPE